MSSYRNPLLSYERRPRCDESSVFSLRSSRPWEGVFDTGARVSAESLRYRDSKMTEVARGWYRNTNRLRNQSVNFRLLGLSFGTQTGIF